MTLHAFLCNQEAAFLLKATATHPNYQAASQMLGISVATLYRKLKRYSLLLKMRDQQQFRAVGRTLCRQQDKLTPSTSLLRRFGYTGPLDGKSTFWQQSPAEIGYYYRDFKTHYRRLLRAIHPDRGGSHEDMVMLNAAWSVIENKCRAVCPCLED